MYFQRIVPSFLSSSMIPEFAQFLPDCIRALEVAPFLRRVPFFNQRFNLFGLLNLLEMVSLDLRGNLRSAQGKSDEAITLLNKAVDKEKDVGYGEPPQYGRPELESLGFANLRAGKWVEARKAFQDEMITRPASGHALYGIAQSYELAGDKKGAARAYLEFLAAWKNADPDLPMMEHAKSASR